jgi:hypothetical protein
MTYVIHLTPEALENMTEFQNLMLNILGGLTWNDLSEDEKNLCRENGYNDDKDNN